VADDRTSSIPWYRARRTLRTFWFILGALVWAAAALAAFVENASGALPTLHRLVQQYDLPGWLVAAVLVAVTLGLLTHTLQSGKLQSAAVTDVETIPQREEGAEPPQGINHEPARDYADMSLVNEVLGGLTEEGHLRAELRDQPEKTFRTQLYRELEDIDDRWSRLSKPIFDSPLRAAMAEARASFTQYWHPLRVRLDGPPDIMNHRNDLQIVQPPGGPWGWDEEKYYDFVRSVQECLHDLLDRLGEVDAALYELKVRVGAAGNAGRGQLGP